MVSFNQIPVQNRVPFAFVEFDNSRASQGASIQPWKILVLGQKLSAGTATALVPVQVSSEAQAKTLFGTGSMLARMFKFLLANNSVIEMWAVPQVDEGSGVAATGKLTVTGPATAAGTLALYIGGQVVNVAVAASDTADDVADAIVTAINADSSLPVTAAVDGTDANEANLTARHKGVAGNYIDVRLNYYDETTPTGISVAITAMSGGTTNPSVTAALDAIGDDRYNAIVLPWTDAANLTAIESELADRWGPLTQNDGHAYAAFSGSSADAATLGNSRNSPHVSIAHSYKVPNPPWEVAAALVGQVANSASIDPARPVQTLVLSGILAPKITERLTQTERNNLLYDGISTLRVGDGGEVRIERVITTYKTNGVGADDPSYLDVETINTLSYLRYDFRTYFLTKYPRHKLASDGTRFAIGQAILTPNLARAECITKFRQWEELGLVEGIDQFKEDLIVERNAQDPNRLDIYLPPDLVNQFRVLAAQIAFRL